MSQYLMSFPYALYFTVTKQTMQFLNSVRFRVLNDHICGIFIEQASIINRLGLSCKIIITVVMGKGRNIHVYSGISLCGESPRCLKAWLPRPLACWDCGFESRRRHECLSVSCECCVLSGGGFCDLLIACPEEYYRV
jgi:hypothetical protein